MSHLARETCPVCGMELYRCRCVDIDMSLKTYNLLRRLAVKRGKPIDETVQEVVKDFLSKTDEERQEFIREMKEELKGERRHE